jgi:hypothetical protein
VSGGKEADLPLAVRLAREAAQQAGETVRSLRRMLGRAMNAEREALATLREIERAAAIGTDGES